MLQLLKLLAAYDESWQHAAFEEFVEESAAVLRGRKATHVVLEVGDLPDALAPGFLASLVATAASYRAEVESLHQKHVARTLTSADLFATTIYSDFEDICDPEDTDWEDFWSDTLYYSLAE